MKFRVFTALGLSALATTLFLGAVQSVAASSDSTITVCANKSTGAIRVLVKGSCKKFETTLTWYTQSTQATTTTTIPTTGRGVSAYDANDLYIGQVVSISSGSWYDEFMIVRAGVYFSIGSDGGVANPIFFTGDNCTGTAFISVSASRQWPRQLGQNKAFLTPAPDSKEIRWYQTNSGTLKLLGAASVLQDYDPEIEDDSWIDQSDGIGKCYKALDYMKKERLHRTVELITPPVVFKTGSPLKLIANK